MNGSPNETPRLERPRRKRRPAQWNAKPKVGDKLGAFRLLEVLGEGGAGAVYRAEHDFLKRPVAIKVLHPELSARPGMVARFFQEALAVNKARHPNIIDITDVVASETSPPYIVMELLTGEDLGDYIDKYSPVAVSEAIPILRQICDAMAVVHELGIVHRDLKPENIFLVTQPGQDAAVPTVKLLDFGIAKFLHSDENRRRTWSGGVLGTPAYMPMEQLHGLPVDHRADIYALGVVTYEMLTGRLPFEIDSMEDLSNQRLTLEPPPPSTRPIHHPPEPITPAIDRVVLRALNDDPSKRFQHVEAYRDALLEALEATASRDSPRHPLTDLGAKATAKATAAAPPGEETAPALAALPPLPTSAPDVSGPEPHAPSRRGRWIALSAAALALTLGGLLWLGRRASTAPQPPSQRPRAAADLAQAPSPRAQATRIRILSHPTHARIHAGDTGAFLGQTPSSVPVTTENPRILELRLGGHKATRITVTADGPNPVQVWLEPLLPDPRTRHEDAGAPPRSRVQIRYVKVRARERPRPRPRGMLRNVSDQGIVDPFHRPSPRATP